MPFVTRKANAGNWIIQSTEPSNVNNGQGWIDTSTNPPNIKMANGTGYTPVGVQIGTAFSIRADHGMVAL